MKSAPDVYLCKRRHLERDAGMKNPVIGFGIWRGFFILRARLAENAG